MNNLSEKMQERLDKWRKNTIVVPAIAKIKQEKTSRRNGKGDFGDVNSMEEWEEESRRSQTRK